MLLQVNILLSAYKQHTGQDYTGSETENKVLSEVAHQVHDPRTPALLVRDAL